MYGRCNMYVFFFKQKTAYEMRISDWSSDVCSSDLSGYHISQSKIAIGSGGIGGKGFLNGSQSHLDYLPEGHTDFIFATMAEEWGLIGGLALLFGFFLLLRWSTRVEIGRAHV